MQGNPRSQTSNESGLSQPNARPNKLTDDDMQVIWECMASIYGNLWSSPHGDDFTSGPALVWADGLSGLARGQIHHGLNACMRRPDPFPPSLGQFLALCLGSSDAPVPQLSPEQRETRDAKRLEYDKAHFRKMRELAAGMGLDLWAHEAEHGIPNRDRPRQGVTAFGRESCANLGKFLQSFGRMP